MKKLSIIIPCYNSAQTIKRCLDSIPERDYIQVIVIDDGSEDGTQEILKEYVGKYEMQLNRFNHGVSNVRNSGIIKALGEFITFLDSDDEYVEGAIDNILKAIEGTQENIIQFNHLRDGKNVPSLYAHSNVWSLNKLPPKWVLCWNKVYRREFIEKHSIFFPEGQQFEEDRIFNFKCFKYSPRIATNSFFTVNKHRTANSLCHTVEKEKLLITARNSLEFLKQDLSPDMQKLVRRCLSDFVNSKLFIRTFGGD